MRRKAAVGFSREDAQRAMPKGKDLVIYNDRSLSNVRRSFIGATGGYYPAADYRDEPWGVRWYHELTDITDWIPDGCRPQDYIPLRPLQPKIKTHAFPNG